MSNEFALVVLRLPHVLPTDADDELLQLIDARLKAMEAVDPLKGALSAATVTDVLVVQAGPLDGMTLTSDGRFDIEVDTNIPTLEECRPPPPTLTVPADGIGLVPTGGNVPVGRIVSVDPYVTQDIGSGRFSW